MALLIWVDVLRSCYFYSPALELCGDMQLMILRAALTVTAALSAGVANLSYHSQDGPTPDDDLAGVRSHLSPLHR
jgi:hypothetical protein